MRLEGGMQEKATGSWSFQQKKVAHCFSASETVSTPVNRRWILAIILNNPERKDQQMKGRTLLS